MERLKCVVESMYSQVASVCAVMHKASSNKPAIPKLSYFVSSAWISVDKDIITLSMSPNDEEG